MARTAVVIGGTGQIGRAVATRLLIEGWSVRLISRGHRTEAEGLAKLGAEHVRLDRDDSASLARALHGGVDAVIDTCAFGRFHAEQLSSLQQDVGAYVVVSTASVYRDEHGRSLDDAGTQGYPELPVPVAEDHPTVEPGPQTYSARKVALEQHLLEQVDRPLTILRPAAVHGSQSVHPREWWFVKRMLDARPHIPLAGGGLSQFHTSSAANIAALTSAVLGAERAPRILNAADPTAPAVLDIGGAIADRLGWRGQLMPLKVSHGLVGVTPWSVPHPLILDTSAAKATGYRPVGDYYETVTQTCDWLAGRAAHVWEADFPQLAAYGFPLFDYDAEDRALGRESDLR